MISFPHFINHKKKEVYLYIESGFPTTMAVPKIVKKKYPGYKAILVSKEYLIKLKK